MSGMRQRNGTYDHVDAIQREWRRVLPAVDASAIGVTGRVTRIALYTDREAHDHFGRFRLSASSFEVLTSLHNVKMLEYDRVSGTVCISPKGISHVEENVDLEL